jgi:hypothetical protein
VVLALYVDARDFVLFIFVPVVLKVFRIKTVERSFGSNNAFEAERAHSFEMLLLCMQLELVFSVHFVCRYVMWS